MVWGIFGISGAYWCQKMLVPIFVSILCHGNASHSYQILKCDIWFFSYGYDMIYSSKLINNIYIYHQQRYTFILGWWYLHNYASSVAMETSGKYWKLENLNIFLVFGITLETNHLFNAYGHGIKIYNDLNVTRFESEIPFPIKLFWNGNLPNVIMRDLRNSVYIFFHNIAPSIFAFYMDTGNI